MGIESTEGSGENWMKLFAASLHQELGSVPGISTVLENSPGEKPQTNAAKDPTMILVHGFPVAKMPDFYDGPPIDEGTPGLCLDAFISVFNEGIADEKAGRHKTVTEDEYWESMFKQDDWAAAVHPRLPYWVWDRWNRRKLNSCRTDWAFLVVLDFLMTVS